MNKRNRTYKNIKIGGQSRGSRRRSVGLRGLGSTGASSRGLGSNGLTMTANPMRGPGSGYDPSKRRPPPNRTLAQRASAALGATGRGLRRGASALGSAAYRGASAVGSAAARGARAVGSAAATGARALGSGISSLATAASTVLPSVLGPTQTYPGMYGPTMYGPGGYNSFGPGGYGPNEYGPGAYGPPNMNPPLNYNSLYDRQPYDGPPYGGPPYDGPPYDGPPYNGPPYNGPPYNGPNEEEYYNNSRNIARGSTRSGVRSSGRNTGRNTRRNTGRNNVRNIGRNNVRNSPRNSGRRISSVSPSLIENEIVPGIPMDVSPEQYDGPQKPGIYKVPFEKDAKTGFLQTMFMTRSPEGYKYYKIYGTDVRALESDIKNFISFVKSTNSPSGKFTNTLDDSIKSLKLQIEEQKAKYDTLEKQFNYLEPEQRTMASQTLALVQSRINNLIEELDDALRIKESA